MSITNNEYPTEDMILVRLDDPFNTVVYEYNDEAIVIKQTRHDVFISSKNVRKVMNAMRRFLTKNKL